jgi:hypothetical protein
MRLGKRTYYEPTLSGWKEYACDNELGEIYFQLWICGVLDAVSGQYSKRLDEITAMLRGPRCLNDFNSTLTVFPLKILFSGIFITI